MSVQDYLMTYGKKVIKYETIVANLLAPEIKSLWDNIGYMLLQEKSTLTSVAYAKCLSDIFKQVTGWLSLEEARLSNEDVLNLMRDNKLPLLNVDDEQLDFITVVLELYNKYKISPERACALINSTDISKQARDRVIKVMKPKLDIMRAIYVKPYKYYINNPEEIVAQPTCLN